MRLSRRIVLQHRNLQSNLCLDRTHGLPHQGLASPGIIIHCRANTPLVRQLSTNPQNPGSEPSTVKQENDPKQANTSTSSCTFNSSTTSPKPKTSVLSMVVDNIRLGYAELMGYETNTSLKTKVSQAITYRKPKPSDEVDEDEERYEGPTSLVAVKEELSPWDAMRARLADAPLIREILKNTQKITKVAADTEVGKKVKEANDHVQDKMEDLRVLWETSQNPLIITMSGIWENITGESEEAIATSAIKRLDPKFVKVCPLICSDITDTVQ
jgi:hypothetical protein